MGKIFVIEGRVEEWETDVFDVDDVYGVDISLQDILEELDGRDVRVTVEVF
jgi:hypothetical protein